MSGQGAAQEKLAMTDTLKCISPIDGSVFAERPLAGDAEIAAALERSLWHRSGRPDMRWMRDFWPTS